MEPVGVNGHTGPDKTEAGATVGRLDPDVHVRTTVIRCIVLIRCIGYSRVRHDDCVTMKLVYIPARLKLVRTVLLVVRVQVGYDLVHTVHREVFWVNGEDPAPIHVVFRKHHFLLSSH